jgi:hypothetical protein
MLTSLASLDAIFRGAWGADTCDPVDLPWSPANPSSGQCGVTTLVLHDLLGGDMLLADVHIDGEKIGHHYWLRLAGGLELDLTRDQFHPQELVGEPQVVVRPPDAPRRCREQYELLRERVFVALGMAPSQA